MVAGTNRPEEIDPGGVRKLLYLIDSLRATPAGSLIYRQAEGMLGDVAANHLRSELAYSGFVNVLLEAFNAHQTPGSPGYVQIKLLQARLQPPLTSTELDTLGAFIEQCGEQIRSSTALEPSLLVEAVSPLLAAFGIDTLPEAPQRLEEVESFGVDDATGEVSAAAAVPRHYDRTEVDYGEEPEDKIEPEEEDVYPDEEIPAGQDLNAIDRSELEARREDIQNLQATLGQQVLETITQNEEFGVILEVALAELRQAEELTEIENLRWTLIREVEKLMKGHNELADKLDSTHHYLQLIESDSRELTDELTRVRLLSLTDELTGLPNRRAFMRRMEDEVARVQRYGFPLSFILMDLDHFKAVNDELGHAAGDEVLRVYSKNILSIFRHHDMVARYGGEEFAVLLPNTDSDGAVRALNKVRRRASETRWQVNGTVSKVPTFSAGVSLYKPGESASAFIERADKALYRAKHLGRNRIELDITYQSDAEGGVPRRRSTDT
ncbi:MAG: GGDEF domain-containing protein [Gammaproteobacteria bacterium]|jgi:diguanylate cyclase|nr:GGDEF domain-containing protein [Gammaproteobacteria bacterium]